MSLYRFPGLEKRSAEFRRELCAMAARLDTDPNFIAAVMQTESGFDHLASNCWCRSQGRGIDECAFGLIQFMPFVLRNYGTTASKLSKLTDVEQLAYVESFYRPHRGRLNSPGDCYMATFLPAYMGHSEAFVLGRKDDPSILGYGLKYSAVYQQNAGFDRNKDGLITVGEVTGTAERNYRLAKERGVFADTEPSPPPDEPAPVTERSIDLIDLASTPETRAAAKDDYIREQDQDS